MMKRTITLLLAIVMLFALPFPVIAYASNTISSNSIEKAISYAYNEKSTRPDYWKGYCAAFVWACYNKGAGISNRSYPTAREMGDALITHTDANPPRGAFVFWYKTSDPYNHAGHVGLSLGDGTVIHAFSSIKVTQISAVNNSGYTYRGWGSPISGYTLDTQSAPAELTVSGEIYPSGQYDSLTNFGLRGTIMSGSTITRVEAHVYDSNGNDAQGTSAYQTSWNSTSYNIQTDGINNHFAFRNLGNGTYRYVVLAQDSSMSNPKVLINSSFSIGATSSSDYQNTWANTGNMAVDIAEVAYTQVGYQETGTNQTKYNQWYFGNNTAAAWCATFVSWCANQAGIPQSIIQRTTYAYPGTEDFNVPYYSFGSVQPEKGDLIFVENNGNLNYGNVYGFDHVGIVYAVDSAYIYTVEGNDGNNVTFNRYSLSNGYDIDKENAYINWIGKPNYSGSQPVVVPTGTIPEKLATILSNYPDGSSWTEDFDGGKQSYGFAKLVAYNLFGSYSDSRYRSWLYNGTSSSGMQAIATIDTCSEASVRDLFLQARPGDVLQFDQGGGSGTQFSMIIYSLTNTGANIYDCNFNGDSIVRLHHMSFSDFVQFQGVGPKGKLTLLHSDNYDSIDPNVQKSIFDLNGYLDNKLTWGNIDGYGTVDVYINGIIAASAVSDYCVELPVGTAYEIRNIQASDGHVYSGVYSGSLSGTIGTERVEVLLSFNTQVYLNIDGFLDGKATDGLAQYGVVDVYINGNKDADGWNDYWEPWIPGTTYEIKNIRANEGYQYDGVYSGELSGTIEGEHITVVLQFSTLQTTYPIAYDANGGTGAPASQIKTHGTALTLSGTEPTRASSSAGSYTVTLNANGGSVNTTSLSAARTTAYTFKNWNTAANGSGTSYNAGAAYTSDAAATLYAQWNSSTTTAAVTLPTPTRDGFTFHGWATSSSAAEGVTGSYTPTENVTLYATWTENAPTVQSAFSIDNVNAAPGGEIAVPIRLENNPGLISVEVEVAYDSSVLEWIGVEPGEYGDTLGDYELTVGQPLAWFAADERTDVSLNGVFATLLFRVNENAGDGETVITLSMDEENIFNAVLNNVPFMVKSGTVTIKSHTPGDINGDGRVNNKDYMALRRYIKYKDNAVVEAALDINGDGRVNNKDYMSLRRYIKYKDIEIQ